MKSLGANTKNILTWTSKAKQQVSAVGNQFKQTLAGGAGGVSREFYNLLTSIGESKSKLEEDRIITAQVEALKKALSSNPSKVRTINITKIIHN